MTRRYIITGCRQNQTPASHGADRDFGLFSAGSV